MTPKEQLTDVQLHALKAFSEFWDGMRADLGKAYYDQDFKRKTRALFMGAYTQGAIYMALQATEAGMADMSKQLKKLRQTITKK